MVWLMCVVGIVLCPRRDAGGASFFLSPAGVPPCRNFGFCHCLRIELFSRYGLPTMEKNMVRRPRGNGVNISRASVLLISFRSCFCFGEDASANETILSSAGVPPCRSKVQKGWYCCWREGNQNASLGDWRLYRKLIVFF